jgi:hypothetical protein
MPIKGLDELKEKLRKDPVVFAEAVLGFHAFPYQAELLRCQSKRIVACWARQTGKTTAIAVKVIHFAFTGANTTTLIVSRGLRQSMIMFGVIERFIIAHPVLRRSVVKSTRTSIQLKNGSQIIALPCGPDGASLRGFTADLVVCVPGYVKVMLENGTEVPISTIKPGQVVLSYNKEKGIVEPKRVLKVRCNPFLGRSLVRLLHDRGFLDCTSDHRIFVVGKGYVRAEKLTSSDKMLYLANINQYAVYPNETIQQAPIQTQTQPSSRAVNLRESSGRFKYTKTKKKPKKRLPISKSLIETSRICSIQILNLKRFRQNSAQKGKKQGMGKRTCKIFNFGAPGFYQNLRDLLQRRQENNHGGMAFEDNSLISVGSLVHGRWESQSQADDDYKHLCLLSRGAPTSEDLVGAAMGDIAEDCRRRERKRLLSCFSSRRKRQILQNNTWGRNSEHELQDLIKSGTCIMLRMWKSLHPETEHCFNGEGNEKKNFLQFTMSQDFRETTTCPPTYTMHSMWKRICSTYRKKDDLQCWLCEEALFGIQESLQERAYETSASKNMCRLRSNFQAEETLSKNLQSAVQQGISPNRTEEEKEGIVYNIEVEDNHNYFANRILVSNCDEAAFMPEDVIASVIFPMLATTNGSAIMLSTPWGRDHIFYRGFKNPNYWSQHVRAEECPSISKEFLEEQRLDIGDLRYRMEYEAEFVEDENSFFSQDLIRECVEDFESVDESQLITEGKISGNYFLGADFGKRIDYSVVVLLKEEENGRLRVVFLKQFALGTPYTEVVAFIQRLNQKFDVVKGFVDQSAVGESLVEEIKEFASQIDGITFTAKIKQDLMILLNARMEQKRLVLPLDRVLLSQINEQQYRFGKVKPTEKPEEKGVMTFYHPPGTHDDQLWSLALAVYAAKEKEPEPFLHVIR